MATGYFSEIAGVLREFDDLFDLYVTGTPPPPTGYDVLGVDLAGRYAPLIYGTQGPDVGYTIEVSPGVFVDLATLWAAKGTASYVSPTAGLPDEVSVYVGSSNAPVAASASFSLARNGTTSWSGGGSGAWYPGAPAGIGDGYDVEFTLSGGFGGTLSGSALNTRLPLSSERGLTLTVSTNSSATATRNVTASIRRIGESAILGTRTFPLTAEANRV